MLMQLYQISIRCFKTNNSPIFKITVYIVFVVTLNNKVNSFTSTNNEQYFYSTY